MHLMMLVMPFGGGLASLVEPVALAQDKKGGPAKGKNNKNKKNDNDGVGPFKKGEYPMAERQRPLVLPRNMGEVTPSGDFNRFKLGENFDTFGIGVGFDYGLANVVEVGLSTGILLAPDVDWNRNFTLRGHYLAYDSKFLDVAPGLVIPLNFVGDTSIAVQIDVSTRYLIPDTKVFLRFGDGAIPLGVSPDFTLGLNVNAGVGYQFTKQFVGTFDTRLLAIQLAPDVNAQGPWDVVDLLFGGQYTFTRNADAGLLLRYANLWDVDEEYSLGISGYGRFRF
jgi:hypothetical protein